MAHSDIQDETLLIEVPPNGDDLYLLEPTDDAALADNIAVLR